MAFDVMAHSKAGCRVIIAFTVHDRQFAGATALMAAAGRGRDAEVSALLANGADVRLTSLDGSTAAGWAARCTRLASAQDALST